MEKKIEKNPEVDLLDKIKDINYQPIFIMGVPRSGTSILYKLLGLTNEFNIITSYHVIKYDELLFNYLEKVELEKKNELNDFFKNHSQKTRDIDKLEINSDFPEEYGFILGQKKQSARITPQTSELFDELCRKIQFISNNTRPVLLKNPKDFSNFIFIKEKFPDSKFIFIHRNPAKTLNSQVNAMNTLLNKKSMYMATLSPWYNKIFNNRFLLYYYRLLYSSNSGIRVNSAIKKLEKSTDVFINNIDLLDKQTDYCEIKYEDLCADPNNEIKKIFDFLGIELKAQGFEEYLNQRKTRFLDSLVKRKKKIFNSLNQYILYCGYDQYKIFD